jgi:hypothetical protein
MARNAADAAGSARPKGENFPVSSAPEMDNGNVTIWAAIDQPAFRRRGLTFIESWMLENFHEMSGLVPAVQVHIGVEFELAPAEAAGRIILFFFFAESDFCAEAVGALQVGHELFYFAPVRARQFHTTSSFGKAGSE